MTASERTAVERALRVAEAKLHRASERRRALPPGSSRARVTSANARWSTAAQAVERWRRLLERTTAEDVDAARAMYDAAVRGQQLSGYHQTKLTEALKKKTAELLA